LHRSTKRRRLANFIRIKGAADSLHADWRSGASTTAGSARSDDEDICRSHGREVVTRWSSKSYAMHCPMRSIELKHCTAQSTQKTQKLNHDMQYYVQYLSNKVEQRIRCNTIGCRRRSCRNIQHAKTFKSSSRNNKEWKNIYQIM
jgi:hypothetical protein